MLKKNYLTLMFLVMVFTIPGVAAYIVYTHPSLLGEKPTNHGKFVDPPVLVQQLSKSKKWHLAYYSKKNCALDCMGSIDKLARIRLALGRHLYDVDGYLFLSGSAKDLTQKQENILRDINVFALKFSSHNSEDLNIFGNDAYFIINPDGYVVLAFGRENTSEDIFQDLKKLVKD